MKKWAARFGINQLKIIGEQLCRVLCVCREPHFPKRDFGATTTCQNLSRDTWAH